MMLKVKKLRRERGLTQIQMSADSGLSQSTISKLETGDQNATLETLVRVADFFGIHVRDLFEDDRPEWIERVIQVFTNLPPDKRAEAESYLDFLEARDAAAKVQEENPEGQRRSRH